MAFEADQLLLSCGKFQIAGEGTPSRYLKYFQVGGETPPLRAMLKILPCGWVKISEQIISRLVGTGVPTVLERKIKQNEMGQLILA